MSEEGVGTAGGGPPPCPCTSLAKTPPPPLAPVPVVSSSPLTSVPSSFALSLFAPSVPALPSVSGGAPPRRVLLEASLCAEFVSRPLPPKLLPPSRASLPSSSCSSDGAPSSLAPNPAPPPPPLCSPLPPRSPPPLPHSSRLHIRFAGVLPCSSCCTPSAAAGSSTAGSSTALVLLRDVKHRPPSCVSWFS